MPTISRVLLYGSRARGDYQADSDITRRTKGLLIPCFIYAMLFEAVFTMTISIELDDELENRIQRLAGIRQRSLQWTLREAIREYVEREEAIERFEQEALASWESYEETGQHLTGQEIRNWLNTWGTDKETEVPPCHE